MKKLLLCAMAVAVALCSCQKVDLSEAEGASAELSVAEQLKDKPNGTYTVGGVKYKKMSWSVGGLAVTRSSVTEEGMTDVWVFDGGTMLAHQVSGDAGFGTVSLVLAYGEHSLSFVASKGEGAQYADGVLTWTKVKDTYGLLKSLNIVGATRLEQTVELSRLNAEVRLEIDDVVPQSASTLDATFTAYRSGLNVRTFGGVADASGVRSLDVTSLRGYSGAAVTYRMFASAYGEEETIGLTLQGKDASGGVIAEWSTDALPLKSNNRTTIKGEFFSKTNGSTFQLNTTWGAGYEVVM